MRRAVSATVLTEDMTTSASPNLLMIPSAVCFLLAMSKPPRILTLVPDRVSGVRSRVRGGGHRPHLRCAGDVAGLGADRDALWKRIRDLSGYGLAEAQAQSGGDEPAA